MTLLMREQEIARDNFEKGMAEGVVKGRQEGREEGIAEGVVKGREEGIKEEREKSIKTLVGVYRELDFEDEIIVKKLIEKYSLIKEEAEKYLG